MQAIFDQLKESEYRRNSDKNPEDWVGISGLDEDLVYRLNIKHPASDEPERMLVVTEGYISTYYDVADGSEYQVVDATPEPPKPEVIGDLTRKELTTLVTNLQDDIMSPNYSKMMITKMTNAVDFNKPLLPKAQLAADWINALWIQKFWSQVTPNPNGLYSFSEDQIAPLTVEFEEIQQESLDAQSS